ncbi:MAG: hypothetical protein HYS81_04910 [Candidatus Aenigmatarchaeota archaeon]|nr:MAG: hypothetical protein HYS81_04910 [Candidatus Aenigmarchaeota archaeon]
MKPRPIAAVSITEAMAVKKEAVENSLKTLLEAIKQEKGIVVKSATFAEALRVEKPRKNIPEAYTQVMELEIEFENLKRMLNYTMKYGPSALEIMEPKEINVNLNEAQEMANEIMAFIHRYAAAGIGGVVIVPTKKIEQPKQDAQKTTTG